MKLSIAANTFALFNETTKLLLLNKLYFSYNSVIP